MKRCAGLVQGAQGYAATMVPAVVSISYINYAIVAVLGGLMALKGQADYGKPGQLSGICAPGGSAHQSVHAAEQLPCSRRWQARSVCFR